jgi:hypothetical protein
MSYLTSAENAKSQTTDIFNKAITGEAVGSNTWIIPKSYWDGLSADNHKKCFLFEGVTPGTETTRKTDELQQPALSGSNIQAPGSAGGL